MLVPQIYCAQVNGVHKEVKVFHKQMAVEYFQCYDKDIMYRDVKRVQELIQLVNINNDTSNPVHE